MRRQLVITLIVTCLLSSSGWVYHRYVNPLLLPPTLNVDQQIPPTLPEHELGPIENRELAAQYLQHVGWVQENPRFQFKVGDQTYIFADEMVQEGKIVRFEPLSIIFVPKKKPEETEAREPFTITCQSGSIELNDVFSFQNPSRKIRIVKGQLRGNVEIRGGDGLSIKGNNFVYSEEAMTVVCDDKRIQFQYDGVEGIADGLVVNLVEDETLKRDGEIPIKEVRSLRLRENVHFNYRKPLQEIDPNDPDDYEGPVAISSLGSMIYDLKSRVAQLLDNVQIHRQTKPGESEHLYASEKLTIELLSDEEIEASETVPDLNTTGEDVEEDNDFGQVKRISATGQPVRLIIEKQDLVVETVDLVYDYQERTAVLGGLGGVRAQMEDNHLECPQLQLIHNEKNDIESVIGLGRGKLVQLDDETQEPAFHATWQKQVQFLHDFTTDHDIVQLEEQAYFEVPDQNFAASAGSILVRLEEWFPPAAPGMDADPEGKRQPVFVRAEHDVEMQMQQMKARNELTQVWIRDLTAAQASQLEQAETASTDESPGGTIKRSDEPEEKEERQYDDPTTVTSREMKVLVHRIHLEKSGAPPAGATEDSQEESEEEEDTKIVVRQADVLYDVMVKRTSPDAERNLQIAGDQVRFQNKQEGQETISVLGQPAEVQGQQVFLTGDHLEVDTKSEEARVVGPGKLRLEISKDLEGKELTSPDVLTIVWQEEMAFSGKTASFYGQVVTDSKMNQSRIHCQTMHVHFSDTLALDNADESESPEIEMIECLESVRLFSRQFEGETLTEIRTGEVWQLRIEPETGNTESIGPGYFEIWSQDKKKDGLASLSAESSVMSNQSLTVSDSKWNYIRVDFKRSSKGNLRSRNNTFEGGVEMIYGPVDHPKEVVQRSQLTDKSGTMSAQELNIHQVKRKDAETGKELEFVELLASGNVRLESETFHARADRVSYEQAKKRYHLRSLGRELVYFWQQEQAGGEPRTTTAKAMTYYPERMQVDIQKVQTLQGAQ